MSPIALVSVSGLRQHDNAEAQILVPVKAVAGDDEHMLFVQELHRKVVRVLKVKLALVQPREQIERRVVGQIIHTVDLIQRFQRGLALLKQAARPAQASRGCSRCPPAPPE